MLKCPKNVSLCMLLLEDEFTLTPKEFKILVLLSEGKSNSQIAKVEKSSYRTVGNHVSSILCQTDCTSRTKLMILFLKAREKFKLRITKREQIIKLIDSGILDPSILSAKTGACRDHVKRIINGLKISQ